MERREFLGGLAILGGLSALAFWDDSSDYEDSQESLQSLADTIDETNLQDPITTPQLIREIETATDTAENGLGSKSTDRARKIADLGYRFRNFMSFLPFVSTPSEPSIENEISATKSALIYYDALLDYLEETDQLHMGIERVEFDILDDSVDLPDPVDRSGDFASHEKKLTDVENIDEQLSVDSPLLSQMLPDREAVLEDATYLVGLYQTYGKVQQGFLSASSMVENGALQRENQEFETARETFSSAVASVDLDLSERMLDSALHTDVLSIGTYYEVLEIYQDGILLMVESCNDPKSEESRREYGDGLERIFDAQQLIAERAQ